MTKVKTYTRADYMAHLCTHDEYYSQFVTANLKQFVATTFGLDTIVNSKCEHFNDIALARWDRLVWATQAKTTAEGVCTLKQAARMLRDEAKENNND